MENWVDWLGGVLFDASLSATVLLCLMALALVGCRQPVRRVHLARLALACSLALIPLAGFPPLPRVPVLTILRNAVGDGEALPAPLADEAPATEAAAGAEMARPPRWAGLTFPALPRPTLVLVPAYVACVAAGSVWLVLGYWGLGWLSRGSRVPAPGTLSVYDALRWDCRRARPVLRVSDRVSRPVLVGAIRPAILIPSALDHADDTGPLRLSLLHELAHAESWDPFFNLVGRLAQVFWFFLPPAWWLRAQLVLDHEFLADRRAASKFGHLPSYAASLLGMASRPAGADEDRPAGADPAALTGSALVQRVLMLVRCPFPVERPPAWWLWSLPALVISTTVATSTLRIREPAAALATTVTTNAANAQPHAFRLSRLTVPPKPPGLNGRAPLFELPIRLPASFDLTVHVWGTPSTLVDTRVVGLRLGTPADRLQAFAATSAWHLVQVRRAASGGPVTLLVDDRRIALDSENGAITSWLSVEPAPALEGQFQHLKLTW